MPGKISAPAWGVKEIPNLSGLSDKHIDAVLTDSVRTHATSVFGTTGVRLLEGISPQDTV